MPNFDYIPKDVLVKVLYDLSVHDLLSFEVTCKHARDTVLTRLIWLNKMDGLDQTCAPDLPPNVDIDSLTAHDLRRIVTTALRTFYSVTSLRSPIAEYEPVKTIMPAPPENFPVGQVYHFRDVRLTPGGRYLFVRFIADNYDQLQVVDLANENNCVWSTDLASLDANLRIIANSFRYDFEALEDGSINLALMIQLDTQSGDESEVLSMAKVLRLLPASPGGSMHQQDIISLELRHPQFQSTSCVVKGRFSVFSVASSKITVVNCQNGQVTNFDCSSLKHGPRNLQIWNDYLFYLDKGNDGKARICAFELSQAMAAASQSTEDVDIEDQDINIFTPSTDSLYDKIDEMRYSFFERRKRASTGAVLVSMIGVVEKNSPQLIAFRVTFNPNKPKSQKWTIVDKSGGTKYPENRGFPTFAIRLGSTMTRSGRLLVSIQKIGRVGYALASINKYGKLVYAELSQNVYYHVANLQRGINTDDMSNALSDFMDPYSGALILLRDRKTGRDAIELFYPK